MNPDYIQDAPPGTYEHCGRECLPCGEPQTAFYRKYKTKEPLRCCACGNVEGTPAPKKEENAK